MKTILFTASLIFAPLCLADAEREHLIYESDSFVNTELRCPSPDGTAELVYRGLRHRQQTEISVVNEIVIVLQNGKEIPISREGCESSLYRSNIIHQPWSPDGKWLVFPASRRVYYFYPVAALQDGSFSSENFKTLVVTEHITISVGKDYDSTLIDESRYLNYMLEGGQWENDGSFTFRAGLSGYLAPYSATVSDEGVTYKQVGDMVKPCT